MRSCLEVPELPKKEFLPLNCAVLTVSDTRTAETDKSGALIAERLDGAGHRVVRREIRRDELDDLRAMLRTWVEDPEVDVVVATGGTGVTRRDVTPEAAAGLFTKPIPGFGELFRMLSYEDIGTSTIQSRAEAGVADGTLVFVLPGSTGACRLAMDKIVLQQLDSRHAPCNLAELLPRIRDE
jgi:molybdenum cofactor biosynthesis protein B